MILRLLGQLEHSSILAARWDALVQSTAESGMMQTLAWSDFKRRQGLICLHMGLFEQGLETQSEETLVGGTIFYVAPSTTGDGILFAPEGPVLPWHDPLRAAEGLRLIMDAAYAYARQHRIIALRIEPRLSPPLNRILREFNKAPFDLIPKETLCVDLNQSESAIMQGMKPKGRYNIKLAQRHGVRITQTYDPGEVERFYSVVLQASHRDNFALEPLPFFNNLAQSLFPHHQARFLFADHEGDTLGAMILITCGARATYLYGGITNHKRTLMAGYALQWEAMLAAKAAGCSQYDFYGYDPFQASCHEYSRFSQFKSRFGGEVVRLIGAQEYFFLDCLADAFIKIANRIDSTQASQPGQTRIGSTQHA